MFIVIMLSLFSAHLNVEGGPFIVLLILGILLFTAPVSDYRSHVVVCGGGAYNFYRWHFEYSIAKRTAHSFRHQENPTAFTGHTDNE